MSSFLLAALLLATPFALASTVTSIAEALRDAGVRVPRIMRAGPWRGA